MPKETVLCGFVLALASILFLILSPGALSLAFVLLIVAICAAAFVFGIFRVSRFNQALMLGRDEVLRARSVQADDVWLALRPVSRPFSQKDLDHVFDRYKHDVEAARKSGEPILPDVEDYVNEELVGLRTWRGVILQIPAVLTGIGILGTFVGLIIGVGGVGFSSVTAAINGVETLLAGIEVAFYTSIAGLSLSILFNLMYRMVWNVMLRNMEHFTIDFHDCVIPSVEVQERNERLAFQRKVVELLQAK